MKATITGLILFISTTTAFANSWTCSAYCLEQNSQDVVVMVERDTFPQGALEAIAKQCAELNYMFTFGDIKKVTLFSSGGEHHEAADVFNSCKQFDAAI